jgi:hypothetical protein
MTKQKNINTENLNDEYRKKIELWEYGASIVRRER